MFKLKIHVSHYFQVSNNLSHIYSEMIFKHGFVHCDPHPGNVLVKRTSQQNAQIVLLDHGLYTVSHETFTFYQRTCRLFYSSNYLGLGCVWTVRIPSIHQELSPLCCIYTLVVNALKSHHTAFRWALRHESLCLLKICLLCHKQDYLLCLRLGQEKFQ